MPKYEDFGFQRSPRPKQPDQGAPDQSAKIAHRWGLSTDSRASVSCFGFAVGTRALSAQNGQLMLKSDKLEFERGAAAKTENQDRYNGKENRHHVRDGTAGS